MCLAVALGGVGWLSAELLRLERAEAQARRQAAVESGTRLALWRMDTAMATVLAAESAGGGGPSALVRCRFVVAPSGAIDGCRLPLTGAALWRAIGPLPSDPGQLFASTEDKPSRGWRKGKATKEDYDYEKREDNVMNASLQPQVVQAPRAPVEMRAYLIEGQLLLLGRAGSLLRGVWFDEAETVAFLLDEVRDLLPGAKLTHAGGKNASRLASIPLALEAGEPAEIPAGGVPVRLVLGVAWGGLVAAGAALAILLVGTLALSERRSTFVSAVTHELRTPLTTLRSYAEMLAEDMVPPGKEKAYAQTLHREAVRLGHLVENVLQYSRLERRPDGDGVRTMPVAELVSRAEERLSDLAAQAGMTLDVGELPEVDVQAAPDAVEQILYNLVDNAGKYAANASDRRIEITAAFAPLRIVVRDFGKGIPAAERRQLFQPFSKSAQRAALSAPGVGLGLALSRRLARSFGADLVVEPSESGAAFAIVLPVRM
jgi:signal transduction histidine kinase